MIEVENDRASFGIDDDGSWRLHDRLSDAIWRGPPDRFGTVGFKRAGDEERMAIKPYYVEKSDGNHLFLSFRDYRIDRIAVNIRVELNSNRVDISYEIIGDAKITHLDLLDEMRLAGPNSAFILPVRSGLAVDAGSGKEFEFRVGTYTYEGLDLAMFGAIQNDSSLLVNWDDPHTRLDLRGDEEGVTATLQMGKPANRVSLYALGASGINGLAEAYREIAREKGYLVTWREKIDQHQAREKLIGAVNFKIWFCMLKDINLELEVTASRMLCSFDEAGEIAEHLKNDLKLDRVLFILGGWTTMGYDSQHPDILPANEECGGSEALARCGDQVKALGYLFGLHDNYQDMYRDAPSWDEEYLMRLSNGEVNVGDVWNGGLAYRICSKKALELARRPQNMPLVKETIDPTAYFTDTTLAARLYECYSPDHPLSLSDDLYYKRRLALYTREMFGIYGSECGREWGIPTADFFEGAAGALGKCYHNLNPSDIGAVSIPLFEMVFHDCIANYGKYHYDVEEAADYVSHHATIGRTLNYHFGPDEAHLYWKHSKATERPGSDQPDPAMYSRAHNGWAEGLCREDRFIKNTYELLSPLNSISAYQRLSDFRFLDSDRTVYRSSFGEEIASFANRGSAPVSIRSLSFGDVLLPPYGIFIESKSFLGFCALSFEGKSYKTPTLFTLCSMDGKELIASGSIRVYHGFGDDEILWRGESHRIRREEIVNPR